MFRVFIQNIVSQWLPTRCLCCRKPSHQQQPICTACTQGLPWIINQCWCCGLPMDACDFAVDQRCQRCIQMPPPFERTVSTFRYHNTIRPMINGLKFGKKLAYGTLLGRLMIPRLERDYQNDVLPGCIVPVPLHARRCWQRGFNQAIEIARPISKAMNIPINTEACQRIRHTRPQSELDLKKRRHNIKKAFAPKKGFANGQTHIAILDDVMTTGSTVTELTVLIKSMGVNRVDVWCCARR